MHTRTSTPRLDRFSQLSTQRQKLVRLCQSTNFGSIRGLEIREGQPVFDPPPVLLIDLKLDSDDLPRRETGLRDFALSREVIRLMERLDERVTATVELLEVRAGIPLRVVFRVEVEDRPPESPSSARSEIHD